MSDRKTQLAATRNSKPDNELFLAFVDAIGKPVANLKVKIETGGAPLELRTDNHGALPFINFGTEVGDATVSALLPTGVEEVVLKLRLDMGLQCYTSRSPYVLVNGQTHVHEGRPTLDEKPETKAPGDIKDKRSKNGNPVRACTVMDCPNDDNLRLCPNQQYKPHILAASKRSGIIPQAISALINAEAGRKTITIEKPVINKKGKSVIGKDGKPRVQKGRISTLEWEEDSKNPRSTARGLTQFLNATWLGQALDPTTYLHTEAVNRKYVQKETKQVITKKAQQGKPPVTKEQTRYVVKHHDKLLAMRLEPEFAIMAAVDYGIQNLRGLGKAGFNISSLNDSEKARLFYLTHHLGLSDAKRFIRNEISEASAETLLSAQIGTSRAEKAMDSESDKTFVSAHRRWLINFVNSNILPASFACDGDKITSGKKLYELITSIGGSHQSGFSVIE